MAGRGPRERGRERVRGRLAGRRIAGRVPHTPKGLRDGRPTLPTPRASSHRDSGTDSPPCPPLALRPTGTPGRTAHPAHPSRFALARRARPSCSPRPPTQAAIRPRRSLPLTPPLTLADLRGSSKPRLSGANLGQRLCKPPRAAALLSFSFPDSCRANSYHSSLHLGQPQCWHRLENGLISPHLRKKGRPQRGQGCRSCRCTRRRMPASRGWQEPEVGCQNRAAATMDMLDRGPQEGRR